MGELSSKQSLVVDAVLTADVRLLPPCVLAKVREQHGGDDLLKRALEENAVLEKEIKSLRQESDAFQKEIKSLRQELTAARKETKSVRQESNAFGQKLDASQKKSKARGQKLTAARKEYKSLRQELDASQNGIKELGQKLGAAQDEIKSLRQELDASENGNKELGQKRGAAQDEKKSLGQELSELASQKPVVVRQLFKEAKQKGDVKNLNTDLWIKACKIHPESFHDSLSDCHGNDIWNFSGMVIHLVTEKKNREKNLLKEKKDLNRSSIKSEIKNIDTMLDKLEAVANSSAQGDWKWTRALSERFYLLCLLVADVNEACHPDMTEELLRNMETCAAGRKYIYRGVALGPAIRMLSVLTRTLPENPHPPRFAVLHLRSNMISARRNLAVDEILECKRYLVMSSSSVATSKRRFLKRRLRPKTLNGGWSRIIIAVYGGTFFHWPWHRIFLVLYSTVL